MKGAIRASLLTNFPEGSAEQAVAQYTASKEAGRQVCVGACVCVFSLGLHTNRDSNSWCNNSCKNIQVYKVWKYINFILKCWIVCDWYDPDSQEFYTQVNIEKL